MARLIYGSICSLDGYSVDAKGSFDWALPSAEVHAFVNDRERKVGTYLYGRRMYETMAAWEMMHLKPGMTPEVLDYAALWQAADKIVFSRTLHEAATARTRLEPAFDPALVGRLKAGADRDLSIGGATLAAEALRAGLVDECWLIVAPHVAGGGTPVWPAGLSPRLALTDQRRFANGMVYLHYRLA